MKRITVTVLIMVLLGVGAAVAQEVPPTAAVPGPPTKPTPGVGRYVFYPAQAQGGLEYLLDTVSGDLWVISRDPDTNYVYLGFIPKGPSFTFQDILRQKQLKKIPTQP
ncbi:MAG: hypothetical protein ACE5EP_03085 [Candidatus Methylomirabilales bacterium]